MRLADKIKQNISQLSVPEVQQDQTAKIEQLKQGLTGKEGQSSGGPKSSRLAERIAQGQVRQQQAQQTQQGKIASEQISVADESQQQQFDDQQLNTIEQALNTKQKIAQQTNNLLDSLARSDKQLDMTKDAAKVEQVGFNLRMNNKKYIDALNNASQRARLDNDLAFKDELQRAMYEDEIELLNNNLNFKRLLDIENRDFMEEMSQLSLDEVIAIAEAQAEQANMTGKFQAFQGIISGGAQMYANKDKRKKVE